MTQPTPTHLHLHLHQLNSTTNQHYQHSTESDWDGTLSATVSDWFTYLRLSLFPSKHLSNSTANLPPLLRKLINNPFDHHQSSKIWFTFLCALWYSTSALSSNTGKAILTRFRFPVTLTIVQFAFVALWSGLCLALRHHPLHHSSTLARSNSLHRGTTLLVQTLGIRIPNRATIRGTCIMSLFSIAGHVFSSMAISRVPVSTVHTIKALSPLFTVIAYAGLFGVRYGLNTYLSLLPLTLGVMLACSFDMRANGIGFLCALGSTVIFVSQNIFGKKLLPKESTKAHHKGQSTRLGSSQMDKLNLLFYSSAIAFLMMIPIWLYTDLAALWARSSLPSDTNHGTHRLSSNGLASYFIFNGTVHFGQCILAFSILSRTSPVTYSIASLIKRIAVICIAIIWFGQQVSLLQGFGMVLTFAGLYIYNQSKAEIDQGEKRRGILEHRQEVLLPSSAADLVKLPEELDQKPSCFLTHLHSDHHHAQILFDNPFRRESLPFSSVQLSKNLEHQQISNFSGRAIIHPSSGTTRQRAPSIPTPASFIVTDHPSPTVYPHSHSLHHHHPPLLPSNQFSSISNHPPPPPPTRSSLNSPLQESNSLRPIVNVR